jgi:hypothetical protein
VQLAQKDHERICLDRFFKAFGKLPTLVEETEAPDFLVHFGTELVGVEVTRLLPSGERGKDSPRGQASLRAKVMTQARSLYEAKGAPPLHVSAAFRTDSPLSGARVADLSAAIAKLLQSLAAEMDLGQRHFLEPCEHTDTLGEIYSLHFMRVLSPELGAWSANSFFFCRPADESDFASVVSRKGEKIRSYRSAVSTVWLLVVVELVEAGEVISANDPIATFPIRTEFDRVFAFNWLTGGISEILVIRPEP